MIDFTTFVDYKGFKVRPYIQNDRDVIDCIYERDDYGVRKFTGTPEQGSLGKDTDLCIDLGAYIGDFSCLWHSIHPEAEIISVETAEENIPCLTANVGSFAKIIHATATYLPWNPPSSRRKINLEEIFAEAKNRYASVLKIDVEGMEFNILENVSLNTLGRIRLIVGEYHGEDEQRFRRLCQEKLPDFFYYCRPELAHFQLYNPYFWWRKECGA